MTFQDRQPREAFDGIICIGGEDWWYHNRGHFDFQIMRRLARRWPVLFVNSIGVRMPSFGEPGLFAQRVSRKLKSLTRGVVEAEPGFWVCSPFSVPGQTGQKLSNWALGPQIRMAAKRAGINKPLLWVHCPAGAPLIDEIDHCGLVLQRTDRFEAFPEGDAGVIGGQIAKVKASADLVVYAAPHLMNEEAGTVARQLLVTHGVEFDRFVHAGCAVKSDPEDMRTIDGPRVGFIGGIDAHTFDPQLFLDVAGRLPSHQFVLVGGCSLPEDWCSLENVHQLGRKPYDQVADYMAAMDVLIMPWNNSPWIAACNPIKLKEYLAVGRPVVTTDFKALDPWRDLVTVAAGAENFSEAIATATIAPFDAGTARSRVKPESWDAKAALVAQALVGLSAGDEIAAGVSLVA